MKNSIVMRHPAANIALAVATLMMVVVVGSAAPAIRVLALGDSLTEGSYGTEGKMHSYTLKLKEILKNEPTPIEVEAHGVSGELVVPTMTDRLWGLMAGAQAANKKFDWVIILGGTNDLGWGRDAPTIFGSLHRMYKQATNLYKAKVVAVTIPGLNVGPAENVTAYQDSNNERKRINDMIRDASKAKDGSVVLFDLDEFMSPGNLSAENRALFWGDLVHPTVAGYDEMGRLLWEKVLKKALVPAGARRST